MNFKMSSKTYRTIRGLLKAEPDMKDVSGFDIPSPAEIDAAMVQITDMISDSVPWKKTALQCMAVVMLSVLDAFVQKEQGGSGWLARSVIRYEEGGDDEVRRLSNSKDD